MANLLSSLKSGSFRGVEAYYQESSETGGFKFAAHEYPGSDNFNIEQLGRRRREIPSRWLVRPDQKDAFFAALNTPGSGILVIPTKGSLVSKVTEFTMFDSINSIGLFEFNVTFVREIGLEIPSLSTISTSAISALGSALTTSSVAGIKSALGRIGF